MDRAATGRAAMGGRDGRGDGGSDGGPVRPGNLTRAEAEERAALVSEVRYHVALDLSGGETEFGCRSTVSFRAAAPGETFLDFAGRVHRVACNGVECNGVACNGAALDPGGDGAGSAGPGGDPSGADARIRLPVREGHNTVEVHATAPYGRIGAGLHRFRDPADGQPYLHTKFEPFDAHRVFACFDQPDLKAVLRLQVVAPASWRVVANTDPQGEPGPVAGEPALVRWTFAPTAPLPTYLMALCAGPFHRIAAEHDGLPLALYARGALLDSLTADAAELFQVTRQGLDFYSRLFDQPYPFAKYEQVFVPEYAFGAMEHPGCVTFNEQFVFRSRVTDESRRRRCEVLLHEMAHMWFGNLVTMRWWDDLWLNESFATFMAALAQESATRFRGSWVSFTHHSGATARHADQLPSSHPVAVDAPDTDAVRLNFDALTYKKGAAVLHQLAAHLGQDGFFRGIRDYLSRHAWGNARLDDFLAALQGASGADLDGWAQEWLRGAGVNTVQVSRSPRGVRLTQLTGPGAAPRPLRVQVGCYGVSDGVSEGAVEARSRVRLDLTGSAELPGTVDETSLLVPNDDGACYLKVRLDEESRKAALRDLSSVRDPMARAVVWGALWDDMLDARLPAREFAGCVLGHGGREPDIGVLQALLEWAMRAAVDFGARDNVGRALGVLGARARSELDGALPGGDRQLVWARILAAVAQHEDHPVLVELLHDRPPWTGLRVDRDLRWRVLLTLAAAGRADDGAIAAAADAGLGDDTDRLLLTVEAARPDPRAKHRAWQRVFGEEHSMAQRKAAMAGFTQYGQEELLAPYVERYFAALQTVWTDLGPDPAIAFTRALYPRMSGLDQEVLAATDTVLAGEHLPRDLARILRDERAELSLSLAARACDADSVEAPFPRE